MKTPFSQTTIRLWLVSLALALLFAFIFLIPRNPGAFRAVPSQTSILIDFNGLVKTGQQVKLITDTTWSAVLKTALFKNCWTEIGNLERVFHHVPAASAAFAKNKLLAAYSLHPADSLHALFILEVGTAVDLKNALESNTLARKFFPYQFRSQTLYTVHQSQNERVVVAQKGRLLIFSRYSYLVEDALTQLESPRGWWADNKYLGDLNPNASLRLFFRPSKWQAQQEGRLLPEARIIPAIASANVAWLGIAWDGKTMTSMAEPAGFLAGISAWNGTERGAIFSMLPDNTAFFAWAGFDNRSLFYKQLTARQSTDFERFVLPWAGTEAALVVTEPLSSALLDDRLLFIAVRDSAKARQTLTSYGQNRGLIAQEQVGMFDVFGFQSQSLLTPFFSDTDRAFQNPYFVHLGNYVVVAPNRPAIEVFIEKYIGNQTLAQNTDFLQLAQRLSPDGRGLVVLNGSYLPRLLRQLFQDNAPQFHWEPYVRSLSKTGWLAAEITPGIGRKMALTFFSQPQNEQAPESNIYWKTILSAPAVTSMFAIAQPAMEIGTALLIQDKQTQLYCLSPDGTITWQKHLGSFIISPIKGIDYYQNGRKCYLFNTKSQVWILDETGKDVEGYPLNLKAPAAVGLTAVDFDKNLKFNYFIGCENGNVYGFDLYGRVLEGWNPQPGVGKPAGPIVHFQHNGKDFLAMLNTQGLLSVFGRDGKPRFEPVALKGNFKTGPLLDKTGGKPRMVCLNIDGVLFDCDPDGKYRERVWTGKKGNAAVKIALVNWAGATAFALLQGKQLGILQWKGNTPQSVFSAQFSDNQDEVFSVDESIGFCARSKQKIILLDKTGNPAKGFPLAGSTPFASCIFGTQKLLVTGNGSAIYAYKIEK